jgi:hypothetical protein
VTRGAAGEVDVAKLSGLKKLRHLLPLLRPLHDCGCARDRAGNRELHFDRYVTLVLLYPFNPLIDSMRGLRQASALERVAKALGVRRFSLGSFSESCRAFAPRDAARRDRAARPAGDAGPARPPACRPTWRRCSRWSTAPSSGRWRR